MQSEHQSDQITLAQMRAVVAVARTGSFSAAAHALHTSQSGISRSVANVESLLDAVLFDRSTRRVHLTETGREFVDRAETALADVAAAIDAVRHDATTASGRHLTVAFLMSIPPVLLAPVLARLGTGAPHRLHCIEALQDGVEACVRDGEADIGVGDLASLPADLRSRPLWREQALVCLPPGHRLADRRKLTIDHLVGEEIIAFPREARLRTGLDHALAQAGKLRTPRFVVHHYDTAFSLVAAGNGVLVTPACAAQCAPAHLPRVQLADARFQRTVGVIWRPTAPPSSHTERFLEALHFEAGRIPHVHIER